MANLFPTESKALITSTTVVVNGDAMPCRGYSVVVADVTIDSTAQVNFEASADGGTTYRYIIGAPTIGTAGTTSATASGHFRFNVAGMDFWRPVAATVSVGAVSVAAIGQAGGTDAVVSQSGGSSVTQGGGFDVRLIASTPTIGTVNIGQADVRLIAGTATAATVTSVQGGSWYVVPLATTATQPSTQSGGWDVRLIAGTATAATVTTVSPRSAVVTSPLVINVGTFASPTLAANANRKSFWFQNAGTRIIYLALGNTPTAASYHFALTSCTAANIGNGGAYFDNEWVGQVNVIADAATGSVAYGETT